MFEFSVSMPEVVSHPVTFRYCLEHMDEGLNLAATFGHDVVSARLLQTIPADEEITYRAHVCQTCGCWLIP